MAKPFLPTVGNSLNTWGDELNAYLEFDHTVDGQHNPKVYYPNAILDGAVTDGNIVYWEDSSDTWNQAIADSSAQGRVYGLCNITTDTTSIVLFGVGDTTASLSPGTQYYLSDTSAGQIVSSKPSSNIVEIGSEIDNGSFFIDTGYIDPSGAVGPLNNFTAVADPGAIDDSTAGYEVGSRWINTVSSEAFVCVDASFGAAIWSSTTTLGSTGGTLTGDLVMSGASIDHAKGGDIASATTTNIGGATGNYLDITGTTTITAFDTVQAGITRTVRFTGILTLTYNATSLILPTSANITTAVGDTATFVSLGSGNWRCVSYQRASGTSLGIKPSFSVHRNGTSQNSITGFDKIEFTTEEFDTNDDFDSTTNYRFTPTVAGKYLLSATIYWASIVAGDNIHIYLYKNGTFIKRAITYCHDTIDSMTVTAVVDANGTSDYFEIYAKNSDRDTSTIIGTSDATYFTGCKID